MSEGTRIKGQYDLAGLRDEIKKHREEIVRLINELIEELRRAIEGG